MRYIRALVLIVLPHSDLHPAAEVQLDLVGSASAERSRGLERNNVRRDRAIDILRGWAVVVMIVGHIAPLSRVSTLLHFPIWMSAADPFMLISGVVLGMRAAARSSADRARELRYQLWRRTFVLWRVHCVLMITVVILHEFGGFWAVAPVARFGGWFEALLMIALLRFQSVDYLNILPLYVVFLLFTPGIVEALRRGWAMLVLSLSMGLWLWAQREPANLPLPAPESGEAVFSLGAWQLVFVLGLVLGFHRKRIIRRLWDAAGSLILRTVALSVSALFVFAQLQRRIFESSGLALPEASRWLVEKQTWGPLRAAYALGFLFVVYAAINYLRPHEAVTAEDGPIRRFAHAFVCWLEWLGTKGLYCFILHIPLALIAALFATKLTGFFAEVVALTSVVLIYVCSRRAVFHRLIPN